MKEFFARLNPMERRFVVGVTVVFFLVANIVWIWPHFGDWAQTQAQMNVARRNLEKFESGIAEKPGLQAAIKKYRHEGEIVPAEEQAVNFLRLILNQAAASGVGIINQGGGSRQTSNTNNPYFVEQNQTITTLSGEKQLVDFLYHLGAGNSLIRVKNLSIQPDPPHQQLTARITLVASYQKKPASTRAGASAPAAPAKSAAPAKPATPASTTTGAPVPPTKPPTSKPPAPNSLGQRPLIPGSLNRLARTNKANFLKPNKQ